MRATCALRRSRTHGIQIIRSQARSRRSSISQFTRELLAPHRNRGCAFDYRPFVLVDVDHRVAVRRAALPGGAEAVLRELPGALALRAGLVLRLARHLAVTRKRQLELGAGGGRGSERLAVEELGLNLLRRELGGGKRDVTDNEGCDCDRGCAHGNLPADS